jgi:hypothetical protein
MFSLVAWSCGWCQSKLLAVASWQKQVAAAAGEQQVQHTQAAAAGVVCMPDIRWSLYLPSLTMALPLNGVLRPFKGA